MMTNGPGATIGEILNVDLERPRSRLDLANDPHYHALRAHAEWDIRSAGMAAAEGHSICDEVVSLAARDPEDDAVAAAIERAPIPLQEESLGEVGLVITASRLERSRIAFLDPAMRARTFTLQEAVALGRMSHARSADVGSGVLRGSVTAFARSLNDRRGLVPLPEQRRRVRWHSRTRESVPLDIPDVHRSGRGMHRRVLLGVQSSARELAQAFSAHVGMVDAEESAG